MSQMAASNDMWTFKALAYGGKWRVTAQAALDIAIGG